MGATTVIFSVVDGYFCGPCHGATPTASSRSGFGVPISLGAAQLIRGQLFGVSPASPHVIVVVCAVLGAATAVATLVPARRAPGSIRS